MVCNVSVDSETHVVISSIFRFAGPVFKDTHRDRVYMSMFKKKKKRKSLRLFEIFWLPIPKSPPSPCEHASLCCAAFFHFLCLQLLLLLISSSLQQPLASCETSSSSSPSLAFTKPLVLVLTLRFPNLPHQLLTRVVYHH